MYRIAHLSDPHINLRYHPQHLPRLRKILRHALQKKKVDHIVISGDITSNADERDLLATRKLFEELDLLDPERLTLTIGNHDIFGGPHLAEELLAFPAKCRTTPWEERTQEFHQAFIETFRGSITIGDHPFPFVKQVNGMALIGSNSIAPYSNIKNPVGSNGAISKQEFHALEQILRSQEVQRARHRIVILHHHLFRSRDRKKFTHLPATKGLFDLIEQETLKLRGKKAVLKLLQEGRVTAVLHGHVHFTGEYTRKGLLCLNGAGAVFPLHPSMPLQYNILHCSKHGIENEVVDLPIKVEPKDSVVTSLVS